MDTDSLTRFLLSLVILVVAAHFFGHWFERLKLPRVIGEISAGIILGPSVLGAMHWGGYDLFLFDEFVGHTVLLNAFYWLGLCMLMFTSGFHIQLRLPADERRDIILLVIVTSTVPFALGWWAVSYLPVEQYMQSTANLVAFKIVFAVSVTVTSIPVISKIFMDLGLMPTKFARVVVATATLHDIILWTAIAVATTVQHSGEVRVSELAGSVVVCLVFIAFFLLLGTRFIDFISRVAPQFSHVYPVGYLLIVCLAMATLAAYINVGAVFGALIAGILFGSQTLPAFQTARETIRAFSMSFFVPIYFAMVGLQINFVGNTDLLLTLKYFVFSSAVVLLTVWPAMRITGHSGMVAWNFSVAMTTRGGPGIVLASLAYSIGIISQSFFVTLILTALVTSLLCGVWFRFVIDRRLELYEGVAAPIAPEDAVKFSFDGSEYRSSHDRGPEALKILAEHGGEIQGMSLQGYLFFLSANRLYEKVKALFERQPGTRFLIFDFRLVTGMDPSAIHSFTQIKRVADEIGARLVLLNLSPELRAALRRRQFDQDVMPGDDLDRALETCEGAVIAAHGGEVGDVHDLRQWFTQALGNAAFAEELAALCERLDVRKGEIIASQGDAADRMHFMVKGRVGIIVRLDDGRSERVRSLGPQATIGEMGLIAHQLRSATIQAEIDSVLYALSVDAYERLKVENPPLYQALLTYVVTVMAERLNFASKMIGMLRR
jgi:Kef-type K+ transport system membrane component KefB/anti-anti-sigma regulatory factor